LGLPAWWWLIWWLGLSDLGVMVVKGMVVNSVAWASRSRLRFPDLFLLSSGVVVVNGVGLGLEVVEPCRIWVFFFFLIFNF
jgi:hypothetical protein